MSRFQLQFIEISDTVRSNRNFDIRASTNTFVFRNVYRRSTHVIINRNTILVFRKYIILAAGLKKFKIHFFLLFVYSFPPLLLFL